MIARLPNFLQHVRNVERYIFHQLFGQPPKELALAYVQQKQAAPVNKFSLKDLIGDGFLLAVPKFRRTIEKRWKRRFGSPQYVWKMLVPKTTINVCHECGHHYERGRLCGNCYKRVKEETEAIQAKIQEKLGGGKPIEQDVIVLYEGENVTEKPKEFWKGKRIIEMKKERPQFFSKNLLQKSTQQPSNATDVKPTDLA
ncbi:hypothetical protein K1T71_005521 [Dendrolimus kikuchii]|uniref:Uncharacterized protein n=1 Tax=Dendrolimus kikuchii TaxID=765133 RepID=A0ACC1D4K3_9NEOP|nr:hypothetical protein K1T71_005521 [Dendrolimus kikuchii]